MPEESLYDVLGVPDTATAEQIRAAYRRLSKQVHPDAGGTAALFKAVQTAHRTLSDPQARAAYDHERTAIRPQRPAVQPPARRWRPSETVVGAALICASLIALVIYYWPF